MLQHTHNQNATIEFQMLIKCGILLVQAYVQNTIILQYNVRIRTAGHNGNDRHLVAIKTGTIGGCRDQTGTVGKWAIK